MADEEVWLRTGSRLAGRYEVRAILGSGGMGVVYEVVDGASNEPIALKTLRRGLGDAQLIKHEFRALADVTHPNLVQLYDLFDDDGRLCLTMELVPGVDLMSELRGVELAMHTATIGAMTARAASQHFTDDTVPSLAPRGEPELFHAPPDLARVRDRFAQLARAIGALHRRGIVHRDIKPHNVRVTPEGRVVLLDFGLAAVVGATAPVAGTIAYMAPEQADRATALPPADWYSFGVLLHEVLTGKVPWSGEPADVLRRKRLDDTRSLRGRSELPETLTSLVDDLLQRDAAARPDGGGVLERLGQRARPRDDRPTFVDQPQRPVVERSRIAGLVGRGAELDQLLATWRGVAAGGSAWIALEGGSGVGKTTLLSAIEQMASPGITLHGRCYEREAVAYKGIDQIVDALVARLLERRASAPEAAELAHAFPAARELAQPDEADAARHGHDLRGAALRSLLGRLADELPVLVALDDIQWADRDCLALFAHALAPPGVPRVLVVVTARPDATARWLELPMPFARIRLGGLADRDAIELAQTLLGRAALTIDGVALARESKGHPFELVERVRSALAEGVTPRTGAARELLIRRVANAPPDVRLVVELVVIAGAPVPVAALTAATNLGDTAVRAAIDRAQLAGLVRTRRSAGRLVVEAAHDHVRETLFDALAPLERAHRASTLAPELEALGHEAGEVAALYVLACQPDAARRCARHAAERMTALGGHDTAASLWRQVAELSEGEARRIAEKHTADSLTLAGRGSEAAVMYQELARSAPSSQQRLRHLRRAAEELLRAGRITDGLALIETSLPTWREPRGAALTMLRGLAIHGATRAGWLPRQDPARANREELELMWAATAGHTLGTPGHFMFSVERHLRAALRSGDPEHASLAWSAEATLATFLGSTRFAENCLHRAAAALGELDSPRARGVATATAALIQLNAGMWARAEAVGAEAAALFDRAPNLVWERNTGSVITTTARLHRGELGQLATGVRRERERVAASGDLYAHELVHSGFSVMADLLADEPARATTLLDSFTARPTGVMTGWLRLVAHGLVGSYGHRSGWHRERADALLAGPLRLRILASPLVVGTMLWTRATLELAAGEVDTARRWIARLRRIPARGMTGLAELLAGHAAVLAGDRAAARTHGCAAALSLDADDMPMFAASARWLVDPTSWATWRDSLAKAGAVSPNALARVFAPSLRL